MAKPLQSFKKFGLIGANKKATKGGIRNNHFTFAQSSGVADWGEVDIRVSPMRNISKHVKRPTFFRFH